jgi:arylsulfatase A-like enzyme
VGRPNVIFVIVDALRNDMISFAGAFAPPTPNIDRLASAGVFFHDAYSCTNATDSSVTSMMTGLYPARHGILRHGVYVTPEEKAQVWRVPMLAEILGESGYHTMAIDWLGRWHRRGFDSYSGVGQRRAYVKGLIGFLKRHSLGGTTNTIRTAAKGHLNKMAGSLKAIDDAEWIVDHMVSFLQSQQGGPPFFLFAHFWDLHAPYRPLERFMRQVPARRDQPRLTIKQALAHLDDTVWRGQVERWTQGYTFVDEVVAAYQSQVMFVDEQLGRFLSAMDRLNLNRQTLVILTSDHGESFCEHGICFDHHGLYESTIHVPLLLWAPGVLPGGLEIRGLVQHIDLVPTLLEFLNIPFPGDWDGRSLLPAIQEGISRRTSIYLEEALTQHKIAIRTDRHKYIRALSEEDALCRYCGTVHGGQEELYDLIQDPLESRNCAQEDVELRETFQQQWSRWQSEPGSGPLASPEQVPGLDDQVEAGDEGEEAIIERLRALDYL